MFRKTVLAMSLSMMVVGCAHFGKAMLPPRKEFFVTTGDLPTKDYQPIALVRSQRSLCRPCGISLESGMQELENALKEDLIAQSKALGANGIINLTYFFEATFGVAGIVVIRASGLAIKF